MEMSTSVALRCRHVISANQWLISIASLSLLLAWRVIQVYDILLSVYICFLPRPGSPRRHLSSQFHLTVSSHIYIPILTITTFFLFHTRFKFNRISLIWKRKKKMMCCVIRNFLFFFFFDFPFSVRPRLILLIEFFDASRCSMIIEHRQWHTLSLSLHHPLSSNNHNIIESYRNYRYFQCAGIIPAIYDHNHVDIKL